MGVCGLEWPTTPKASVSPKYADLAWAAGFLEGEGWFSGRFNRIHKANDYCVSAGQVNVEPLYRLQALFGGTVRPMKVRPPSKPAASWRVNGGRARGVMMTMFPFMSDKRKAQIRVALGHAVSFHEA